MLAKNLNQEWHFKPMLKAKLNIPQYYPQISDIKEEI